MKLGVMSDTHGDVPATAEAVRLLDENGVSLIIHCGDVGPEIIPLLKGRQVHFALGNMDDPHRLREALIAPEHVLHERLGALELAGCRVAFLHGHEGTLLHQTISSGEWDLVCHGHTHDYSTSRRGRTLVLNSGAVARTSRPMIAVAELPTLNVRPINLKGRRA